VYVPLPTPSTTGPFGSRYGMVNLEMISVTLCRVQRGRLSPCSLAAEYAIQQARSHYATEARSFGDFLWVPYRQRTCSF
jgi:hypothetical protein